jgi:hypothetical protein
MTELVIALAFFVAVHRSTAGHIVPRRSSCGAATTTTANSHRACTIDCAQRRA